MLLGISRLWILWNCSAYELPRVEGHVNTKPELATDWCFPLLTARFPIFFAPLLPSRHGRKQQADWVFRRVAYVSPGEYLCSEAIPRLPVRIG